MNKSSGYIADTNINTLKEGGIEVEFEALKDCKSAEDVYFRKFKEYSKIRLGSPECIKMVKEPDGCIECPNFVKCILNKEI